MKSSECAIGELSTMVLAIDKSVHSKAALSQALGLEKHVQQKYMPYLL